jgi:hypothetical protein
MIPIMIENPTDDGVDDGHDINTQALKSAFL